MARDDARLGACEHRRGALPGRPAACRSRLRASAPAGGSTRRAGLGTKPDGGPERQDGSSFAAPQVTAAAAILKSLNPKLTAGDIKRILSETARSGVPTKDTGSGASSSLVAPDMGGRVLALDDAVLKVINDLRKAKGLPVLTPELLEKMGVIDAVAVTGEKGEYAVRGIVGAAGEKGTDVKIEVFAENSAVGGSTEQFLKGAGETKWNVTLPEDKGVIKVTRMDNGAASVITIEQIDINGNWTGSFTVTDVQITDQEAVDEEGCGVAILAAMKGKPMPMTLDVTVDEAGNGTGVMFIDASSMSSGDSKVSSEPKTLNIAYSGGVVTFSFQEGGSGISSMTATVSRQGDTLLMNGSMAGGGKGWTVKCVFKVTKPAPAP